MGPMAGGGGGGCEGGQRTGSPSVLSSPLTLQPLICKLVPCSEPQLPSLSTGILGPTSWSCHEAQGRSHMGA